MSFTEIGARSWLQCWQSSNQSENPKIANCSSSDVGCRADWEEVNGVITHVTKLGCSGLHELVNCTASSCFSLLYAEKDRSSQSYRDRYHDSNQTVYLHICCCSGDECNLVRKGEESPSDAKSIKLVPISSNASPTSILRQAAPHGYHSSATPNGLGNEHAEGLWQNPWLYCIFAGLVVFAAATYFFRKESTRKLLCKRFFSNLSQVLHRSSLAMPKDLSIAGDELESLAIPGKTDTNRTKVFVDCEIDLRQVVVDFEQQLGKGKFGTTHKAKMTLNEKENFFCFKDFSSQHVSHLQSELYIYRLLASVHHPNIVRFYRPLQTSGHVGFLIEYCEAGSLRDHLAARSLDLDTCFSLLCDLVNGIDHLHSFPFSDGRIPGIVHRDISSGNMLLRQDMSLAVSDFGSAASLAETTCDDVAAQHLAVEGTPYYVAPELLDLTIDLRHPASALKQADIYSMALVMWEMVNRCHDFYGKKQPVPPHALPFQNVARTMSELCDHVIQEGGRPRFGFLVEQEESCGSLLDSYVDTVESVASGKPFNISLLVRTLRECWDKDEETRLSASSVGERLGGMVAKR